MFLCSCMLLLLMSYLYIVLSVPPVLYIYIFCCQQWHLFVHVYILYFLLLLVFSLFYILLLTMFMFLFYALYCFQCLIINLLLITLAYSCFNVHVFKFLKGYLPPSFIIKSLKSMTNTVVNDRSSLPENPASQEQFHSKVEISRHQDPYFQV